MISTTDSKGHFNSAAPSHSQPSVTLSAEAGKQSTFPCQRSSLYIHTILQKTENVNIKPSACLVRTSFAIRLQAYSGLHRDGPGPFPYRAIQLLSVAPDHASGRSSPRGSA